ncbi:MAG: LD-carboxypeptidase [Rhizomicrobium sp.]|jgi:muramoyltetrapeptide carboxypeptidase
MAGELLKIGVVAPASRIEPSLAERVIRIAHKLCGDRVELIVHPQCFLSSGHFAGDDAVRAGAFVEIANDPSISVVWIARGGYGSNRILESVLPRLREPAYSKTWLGYSDAGFLLGALYASGIGHPVHGPMPADLLREEGEVAVTRALAWLVERKAQTLEPSLQPGMRHAAFNLTILSHLIGTPYAPDLADHVLMLEEVSEHTYRIDRALFHITSNANIRKVAGIRLGRCSAVPPNDPAFGKSEEEVTKDWCNRAGITYFGRAEIGHDADNRIVPFGQL